MQNFSIRIFLPCLLMLMFCSSCSRIFAPSNHHQIVNPNKKGALQLTGGFYDTYDQGDVKDYPAPLERYGYGAQLGYSPVERLGVIANFIRPNYIVRPVSGDTYTRGGVVVPIPGGRVDTTNAYFGHQMDIAIGAYWKKTKTGTYLVKKNKDFFDYKNEWLFDAYAGVGKGHLNTNYSIRGRKEIDFNLFYIQGGVHWRNGKVGLDLVQRFVGTNFTALNFNGNIFKDDLELASKIIAKPFRFSSRTALRLNVGPSFGKIYLEGNWPNFSGGLERFYFSSQSFSLGVILELDACFRSLKKK